MDTTLFNYDHALGISIVGLSWYIIFIIYFRHFFLTTKISIFSGIQSHFLHEKKEKMQKLRQKKCYST